MPSVAVVGCGTMGCGIAQIAAQHDWTVRLLDVDAQVVRKAIAGIEKNLDRLVEKGKLLAGQRDATVARLQATSQPAEIAECELLIEAVFEDLDVKVRTLAPLIAATPTNVVVASNTSSLSISKIAHGLAAIQNPKSKIQNRLVGMHFFNPVPLMPLVEIIAGDDSDPLIVQRAFDIATSWGKTCVRAKDTPGFIVNRVARGYYLESLRMLGEGVAGVDEIDRTLKTLGGFRMGPFELMDLIGIDVNYAVTCSVWEQMGRPARLKPHEIQKTLVDRGELGRKTGRGFYSHAAEHPLPAVPVERRSFDLPAPVYQAVRRFVDGALGPSGPDVGSITEQYVFARVLAAIVNEAAIARDDGVATAEDIDTAMKLGTNYPRGPFEWIDRIGRHTCAALLRALNQQAGDGRFEPAGGLV